MYCFVISFNHNFLQTALPVTKYVTDFIFWFCKIVIMLLLLQQIANFSNHSSVLLVCLNFVLLVSVVYVINKCYLFPQEPELPELTASGDEEGEKTSTNDAAEAAAEGDELVMERVPSASARSKAADETSSVREGSQAAEAAAPQTNPETGEDMPASAAVEGAEGGGAEDGEEHQTTPPLPRTVSTVVVVLTLSILIYCNSVTYFRFK